MTSRELTELDEELASGVMSDDEYLDRLRCEVSRLHPDYEQIDIDNMFKMQLRLLSVEDDFCDDACSRRDSLAGIQLTPGIEDPNGNHEAFKLEEAEAASEANGNEVSSLSDGQQLPDKEDGSQFPDIDKHAGNDKPQKQDNKDSDKSPDNSPENHDNGQPHQKQDQQKDQNKDKNKDKSKSKSSKWWWTWQIVPDWNEWMKDEDDEPSEISETSDLDETAAEYQTYESTDFDKESAITLTQQEDGTFSLPEREINHA